MVQLKKSIVLMGIKHCGKSTLGNSLASYFACPFFDTDDLIIELTQKTPRQIFTEDGQEGFIVAEAGACKVLAERLSEKIKPATDSAIIATGGGICKNEQALRFLRSMNCLFVFLEVPEKLAADRIISEAVFEKDPSNEESNITNLPSYISKKNPHTQQDVRNIFHDFFVERTSCYKAIADLCVRVNSSNIEENTRNIVNLVSNTLKSD